MFGSYVWLADRFVAHTHIGKCQLARKLAAASPRTSSLLERTDLCKGKMDALLRGQLKLLLGMLPEIRLTCQHQQSLCTN